MNVYEAANSISLKQVISHYTPVDVTDVRKNISCPFHDDKSPSFKIYEHNNTFHCFSCKANGTPINFIMALKGVDALGAAEELCQVFNKEYRKPKPVSPEEAQYLEVYEYAANHFTAMLRHREAVAFDFFNKRKISPDIVAKYKLGYALSTYVSKKTNKVFSFKELLMQNFPGISPELLDTYGLYDSFGTSMFAGRFVFPIHNKHGKIVGFAGRATTKDVPKYVNTAETKFFRKKEVLYNYHIAKRYPVIFVVEGYTDALSFLSEGIENVVALMGTALTEEHIRLFKDKEIVLALDNDIRGQVRTVDIIQKFPDRKFKVYQLQKYGDFNDKFVAGESVAINIDKETVYAPEFLIQYYKKDLDLGYLYNREFLYNSVMDLATNYSKLAQDYFEVILYRLLKGRKFK